MHGESALDLGEGRSQDRRNGDRPATEPAVLPPSMMASRKIMDASLRFGRLWAFGPRGSMGSPEARKAVLSLSIVSRHSSSSRLSSCYSSSISKNAGAAGRCQRDLTRSPSLSWSQNGPWLAPAAPRSQQHGAKRKVTIGRGDKRRQILVSSGPTL
jgi:hypothetical protein